jgi:hypothetical protein
MVDSCEYGNMIIFLPSPSFYIACNFQYVTDCHYYYLFLSWEELISLVWYRFCIYYICQTEP